MPSLLQKSDQSQAPQIPAWHPDFRHPSRLPDTKVVRTQFFVNFAAIAVAASLLLFFSYQEYRINNLSRQAVDWQTQIDTNRRASVQAVTLSQRFAAEERKIDELKNFVKARLVLSQFLLNLGNTLPQEMAISSVEIRNTGANLHGIANGSPDEASGRTSTYVEQLRQDKYFSTIFEDVGLTKLDRDQATGRLTFDLSLRFKGSAVKK